MTSTLTSSAQEFDLQKSYEFLNAALSSFSVSFDSSSTSVSQKYQKELTGLLRMDSSGDSLITRVVNHNPDLLQTIVSLTGKKIFFQNLLRFTTRDVRKEIIRTLDSFSITAISKAESVFNRNIVTLGEQGFDSRLPFPLFFLTQAKLAVKLRLEIAAVFSDFDYLAAPQTIHLDEKLSEAADRFCSELGFSHIDTGFLTFDDDLRCFRKLGTALETFFCGFLDSLEKIEFSCVSSSQIREVYTLADRLRSDATAFLSDHTRLHRSHLHSYEDKRSMLSTLLFSLHESLVQFRDFYEIGVVPDALVVSAEESPVFLSNDVMNLLILESTAQGHSTKESTSAISKLFSYCALHSISASKVITAELKKIHPALNEQILTKLSSLSKSDPISGFVGSKRTRDLLFRELQSIKGQLLRITPSLFTIWIAFISIVGIQACAVRTNVQSPKEGLRPAVFEPVQGLEPGPTAIEPKTSDISDQNKSKNNQSGGKSP